MQKLWKLSVELTKRTLEKIYNSNYLYNETLIWSACNICSKNAAKSAARSFPLPTWVIGPESDSIVVSFPDISNMHFIDRVHGKKTLTHPLKNLGYSSTPRNWNLSFFWFLLSLLYKLINYVMPLYNDTFEHFFYTLWGFIR